MDRREEIYSKTLELFIAEGYDNTPVSRIAEAIGLTKAGLYHYFKSKEELLFLINEYYLKKDFIPLIEEAEKISDPETRISYFLSNYVNRCMISDASARVLVHEIRRLKPEHYKEIREIWKRFFKVIRDAISELEDANKMRKVNKTFAAFAAIGMCSWTFYWFDYSRKESAAELSDTYVKIFLEGILKD